MNEVHVYITATCIYLRISVQSFDAVEYDIERPWYDACAPCFASSLYCVCLPRVGNAIGEQQGIPSIQDITDQRQGRFAEEIGLGRVRRENMREGVNGGGVDCHTGMRCR